MVVKWFLVGLLLFFCNSVSLCVISSRCVSIVNADHTCSFRRWKIESICCVLSCFSVTRCWLYRFLPPFSLFLNLFTFVYFLFSFAAHNHLVSWFCCKRESGYASSVSVFIAFSVTCLLLFICLSNPSQFLVCFVKLGPIPFSSASP